MILDHYVNENLGEVLFSRENYKPFPTIEERNKWDELPPSLIWFL